MYKNITIERKDPGFVDFKNHDVSNYYDIEKLKTQTVEELYLECERLDKLIIEIKNTLEKHDPLSSYFLASFEERIKIIDQLNALTEYFKYRMDYL